MPGSKRPFQDITDTSVNQLAGSSDSKHKRRPRQIQQSLQCPRRAPFNRRALERSLHGRIPYSAAYADLSLDSLALYCRPSDVKEILHEDSLHIPFAVATANTCTLAATADEPGVVRIFDHSASPAHCKNGMSAHCALESVPLFSLPMHNNAIFDLAWSQDDKLLATASGDQTIHILDVQTQTVLTTLQGHTSTVKQVQFDPAYNNGNRLVSGGRDGRVCIWDLRDRMPNASGLAIHAPAQAMDAAHGHTESVKHAKSSRRAQIPAVSITALALLPSGNLMTSAASGSNLLTWDPRMFPTWPTAALSSQARQRAMIKSLVGKTAAVRSLNRPARSYGVASMALSDDKHTVYAMSRDSKIHAYSTAHPDAGPQQTWQIPEMRVESFYCKIDVSNDGFLACGNTSGSPVIIDTRYSEEAVVDVYGDKMQERTSTLARTLSDFDQASRTPPVVVNTDTARPQQRTAGYRMLKNAHAAECTSVSWSHDGQALLTIGDDCIMRTWRRDLTRRVERERLALDYGEESSWGCMETMPV
ncbi:WD40-repeat-containing domain protein [Protomyces lactucae-debilis]|uniref:WD40-repeat-containing domain protein n=1 Tax=Protomyces lactucae-debilis TaxID=2754530 RepID=A0A1Y2FAS2_PROLT|nr:WD40-repeat-containing domain protein [Protomyces lactucae-debilis]ORY81008.1 WD40-repeat-containing domain protein [Protomyces lactucae-debilis]